MNPKSIHQRNTEDHQHLRQLFQRFQNLKATDQLGARKVFDQFKLELERHIMQEERVLFPWFEYKHQNLKHSPISILKREHGQVLVYVDDIVRKLAQNDFSTDAEEKNAAMALHLHNQHEDEVFPALDDSLTEQEHMRIHESISRSP